MTERLLQFIWQFQYYNRTDLRTTSGEELQIIQQGQFNTNQGPDFLEAKIRIGKTTLIGNIELHLSAEDWEKHDHQFDRNYQNVILHVLWNPQKSIFHLPTLVLSDKVPKLLLHKYEQLMFSSSFVPCSNLLGEIPDIIWTSWKERMIIERLEKKSILIESYLRDSNEHWEQVFWLMIARNFGNKVNAESFEAIARSIPLNLLAKHRNQIHQLEAILFGQAGLLNRDFDEDYPSMLKKEYLFYKRKYGLKMVNHPIHLLRMRPGNFPTIRLAQLAMLINQSSHLFSLIKSAQDIREIRERLQVTANDYWCYHYLFDQTSEFKPKKLGEEMINNILVNTISPILFAYGSWNKINEFKTKATSWLQEIEAEKNSIMRNWESLDIHPQHAADSQALLHLKKEYCDARKCLECAIGNKLLKTEKQNPAF